MLRIHPFVMGHLVSAVMVGGVAGAFLDARAALIAGASLGAGAVVSSLFCQWRPGVEAAAWKLWPVAVFANPVMLAALGFMAVEWECVLGTRRGWNCIGVVIFMMVAGLCLLPPIGGLLWRLWKRHRAPRV